MNKYLLALMLFMPFIASERRREILRGQYQQAETSRISRLLEAVKEGAIPMGFGGILGAQLLITCMAAPECSGWDSHYFVPMKYASVACGVCGACCCALGIYPICDECRKTEFKRHD